MSYMDYILICLGVGLIVALMVNVKQRKAKKRIRAKTEFQAKPGYMEMRVKIGVFLILFFAIVIMLVDFGLI